MQAAAWKGEAVENKLDLRTGELNRQIEGLTRQAEILTGQVELLRQNADALTGLPPLLAATHAEAAQVSDKVAALLAAAQAEQAGITRAAIAEQSEITRASLTTHINHHFEALGLDAWRVQELYGLLPTSGGATISKRSGPAAWKCGDWSEDDGVGFHLVLRRSAAARPQLLAAGAAA